MKTSVQGEGVWYLEEHDHSVHHLHHGHHFLLGLLKHHNAAMPTFPSELDTKT